MVDRLFSRNAARFFLGTSLVMVANAGVASSRLASQPDPELVASLESPPPAKAILHRSRQKRRPSSLVSSPSKAALSMTDELAYPDGLFSPGRDKASAAETTLAASYKPAFREKHFSFIVPSIVVHGVPIDKDVANQMPRKIDGGQTVVTPGVGLEYRAPNSLLLLGGVLKDCYDDLAGLIQVGQQFRLGKRTSIGYSVGVYARETPVECTTTYNRRGRATTTCDEFDAYNLKWTTQINNESVDIIPMPFLHFTTALYHDENVEIDFKVLSNFALNEFGFSVPF